MGTVGLLCPAVQGVDVGELVRRCPELVTAVR